MNKEKLEQKMIKLFKEQPEIEILEKEEPEHYNIEKVDDYHTFYDVDITNGFIKYLLEKEVDVYKATSNVIKYKWKPYSVKTYKLTYDTGILQLFNDAFDMLNLKDNDIVIVYLFVSNIRYTDDFILRCLVMNDEPTDN